MTLRYSRRKALQAGMAAAAVATLSHTKAAASQSTPIVGGASTISPEQVAYAISQLDGLIEEAMALTGVPGVAVAVVYNDDVVYERAFGVREVGKPEPVTPETVFQVASMSKPVSSSLVAAVVGDGHISWDSVAADALPGFALSEPWLTSQVTLRDLFSHRSGLPAYAGDPFSATFGYGREESVERLRRVMPTTPLRTAFAYTNLGLSVAAYAAAEAAGLAWEDLADERFFAPLGMTSSSYRLADYLDRVDKAAPHYRTRDGVWALGEVTEGDVASPAGGLSTNVRDLTQWMRLQLGGGTHAGTEVVTSAALLETHRPQILEGSPPDPAAGPALFYGLGWRLNYDDLGQLHVHHIGDFNSGFRTGVHLLPAAGLGIVVLTNAWPNSLSDGLPRAFYEIIAQGEPSADWVALLDEQTALGLEALRAAAPFPAGDPPATNPALPFEAYTGSYTSDLYGEIAVREENDRLVLELGPLPTRLELTHWDRDGFTYPLPPSGEVLLGQVGVQFLVGPLGTATAMAFGLPTVGPDATAMFLRVQSAE